MIDSCNTCRFSRVDLSGGPSGGSMSCCRHAPRNTVFLVPGPGGQPAQLNITAFPIVQKAWVCGEYQSTLQ